MVADCRSNFASADLPTSARKGRCRYGEEVLREQTMFKLTFEELADSILRSGLISEAEFETDMRRLDELDFLTLSPMMWTTWGQVPEALCGPTGEGLAYENGLPFGECR